LGARWVEAHVEMIEEDAYPKRENEDDDPTRHLYLAGNGILAAPLSPIQSPRNYIHDHPQLRREIEEKREG
jgi:hypothetical protein